MAESRLRRDHPHINSLKWCLFSLCCMSCLVSLWISGCGNGNGEDLYSSSHKNFAAFTVMTYNVLFAFPNPGYDSWDVRKEFVAERILDHDPDLIGLQEPFPNQVKDLLALCPGYASIPFWYTDATILYREERFQVLSQGVYWLSPTPDDPLSVGFGNFLPRIVLWARVLDLDTDLEFFFVNTHFDNTSPSQEKSAPLFLERTGSEAGGLPILATGDFNSKPASTAYEILTQGVVPGGPGEFLLTDAYFLAARHEVAARPGDPDNFDPSGRIDHIFLARGGFSCPLWIVDMTTYGEERKVPSDHFPVVADIRIRLPE